MKFGNSVADIFIIKHTQFGQDTFGLDNFTVHCLGVQFFRGHSVFTIILCYLTIAHCQYPSHCIIKPVRKYSSTAELEHQQWYRRLPKVGQEETALDPTYVDQSAAGRNQLHKQLISELKALQYVLLTANVKLNSTLLWFMLLIQGKRDLLEQSVPFGELYTSK